MIFIWCMREAKSAMVFNSLDFLIFFPIVVCIYFLIPQKMKWIWLLISSYYFYMSWNPQYAVLIATSTIITWLCGRYIGKAEKKVGKIYLMIGVVSNLSILFFFKYFAFFVRTVIGMSSKFGITIIMPSMDVLLPVGISFYTFQAIGYMIDIYRKEIEPEKNILKYALFVSFFPQLVAGPIERSKNLITQIHKPHYFDGEQVKDGLILMGWGFFKKLVLADRIAILVTAVYDNYMNYSGIQIVVATILFAVQIYCDFSGYSDIAIGAAQIMDFKLMSNFESPYFTKTVSEFWRRWHISLTTWFRDYVYIPLGGNRNGKKYRNILITFGLSGLWHGASWNYVAWGLLNGIYQVVGDITANMRKRIQGILHVNIECLSYRMFRGLITFVLVDFAWLFFRADSLRQALAMIVYSIQNMKWISMLDTSNFWGINTIALDEKDFYIMLIAIVLLIIVDYFRKIVDLRSLLAKQNLVFRYIFYYVAILIILIFGVYGPEYDASTFIYFQF